MKQASSELIALLAEERFVMADLYTFTLRSGSVFRYSSATTELFANGFLFRLGPKFERSRIKIVIGVAVDELELMIYPEPTDLIGVLSFLEASWLGIFDGALLQVERAFMPVYGDTAPGTIILFAGRVSDIGVTRTAVDMKCRSHLELLATQMPKRLWGQTCSHLFGGQLCLFNRRSLTLTFSASARSTPIIITGAPITNTPYTLGTITGLTGDNAGFSRTIGNFRSGDTVSVKSAFFFPVLPGDLFEILPGCDLTLATCRNIYNNEEHFGGEPFIPTAETSV